MTEKTLYTQRIKPLLDGIGGLVYNRIEVKGLSRGVPDITYSFNGHHGWIELKYHPQQIKLDQPFKLNRELTASQRWWLTQRGAIGGHCWVFVGTLEHFLIINYININKIFENKPATDKKMTWSEVVNLANYASRINTIDPIAVAHVLA